MKLVTFRDGRLTRPGLVHGDHLIDLSAAWAALDGRPDDLADLGAWLAAGGLATLDRIELDILAEDPLIARDLDLESLLAPILRPPKIVCIGMNYADHAAEKGERAPDHPLLFAKAANTVVGPGCAVVRPPGVVKLDYEVELCVVVAGHADMVSEGEALRHVLGYTIALDMSARDVQYAERQFYRGKSFRGFCPMGPWIVSAAELDPSDLQIALEVNGEVRQKSRTSQMLFGVARLVAEISGVHPLEPGDLILTGTPPGVGVFRQPPVFLQPGDRVTARIEGIGELAVTIA